MKYQLIACLLLTWCCGQLIADEPLRVLDKVEDLKVKPSEMLHAHLMQQVDEKLAARRRALAKIKTPQDIAAYQARMRRFFTEQLGPMPEKTPLNPVTVGRVIRDGFTVEKVLFESRPKFYVTGAYFQPDREKFPPPHPGVLVVCGHSKNGKAYSGYQKACALLAVNGIAAFIIDPIGQGERHQLLGDNGQPLIPRSTAEHSALGEGAALLGRNTASFEVWDGIRGIDYLLSRKEIDPEKIGCMGNSGGGTQTAYLMALDERIVCASPSCYITSFDRLLKTIGPQDAEQNIAGQIGFGMDHADYLMMRAPKPTLICAATQDFFDIKGTHDAYKEAKAFYALIDDEDCVAMVETDAKHGYSQPLREAAVQWMVRWLREENREIKEPELDILTDKEIQVTEHGQVMRIADAVSAFELNQQLNQRLTEQRASFWKDNPKEKCLDEVRRLAAIRPYSTLPMFRYSNHRDFDAADFDWLKRRPFIQTYALSKELHLPIVMVGLIHFEDEPTVLCLDDRGLAHALRPDGPVRKLVAEGRCVIVADVRGVGELRAKNLSQDATISYLLDASLLGQQAEDILHVVRLNHPAATGSFKKKFEPVDLIATGNIGPAALHAAAIEPDAFRSVRIEGGLASWSDMIDNPTVRGHHQQVVHGALTKYDLPDLVRVLGDKVEIVDPIKLDD